MKRLLLTLILIVTWATGVHAGFISQSGSSGSIPRKAFAALPTGVATGTVHWVTNTDGTGCNASGSTELLCVWNGAAWVVAGTGTFTISGASTGAAFLTTQAEAGLSAEFNLGSLTTGLLKHSVSGGVSTPATAVSGTDYAPATSGSAILKGNGSGGTTAAVAANVVSLFTGTPDGTKYLRDDGTIAVPPGGSGSPGGSTTQFQYNNSSAFAGSSLLTTNGSTLSIGDVATKYIDFDFTNAVAGQTSVKVPSNSGGTATIVKGIANPADSNCVTYIDQAGIQQRGTCGGGGGSGDVTAASNFGTDNVVVRSNGTSKGVQSTGVVIDDDNNVTIPGGLTIGSGTNNCSGTAGCFSMPQGTAPSAIGSNEIQEIAPTSVTSYRRTRAGASCAGFIKWTQSTVGGVPVVTESCDPGTAVRPIYFDAAALTPDGTNCAAPSEQTLNSGPKTWTMRCADSNSSIFYGKVRMPPTWNAGTVTFTLSLYHATTETITFAGDFAAACRAAGGTVNSTYGTAVAADVAITTAHQIAEATTTAVTPNGTCAANDWLFFKYTVDATNFSANAANAHILGVAINATY